MGNDLCGADCLQGTDSHQINFMNDSHKNNINNNNNYNEIISSSHKDIKVRMKKNKDEKEEAFYLINKNTSTNDNIDLEIKFNCFNDIKYPKDFKIIKREKCCIKDQNSNNSYLIATIKDYIIIKDNKDKKKFYVCSLLKDDYFNVDFIFVFDKESKNCYNQIYGTIYSSNFGLKINIKDDFFGAFGDKLGFYICLSNEHTNNLNSNNFNNAYINNVDFNNFRKENENQELKNSNNIIQTDKEEMIGKNIVNFNLLNMKILQDSYKDHILPNSIIKKLFYLYCNDIFIKNKIKNKEISPNIGNIKLMNKNWLNKYKQIYKYTDVIKVLQNKDINDISTLNNSNIINFVDNKILKNPYINMPTIKSESKLSEDMKLPQSILPSLSNDALFKYPENFELIKTEIFELLIKEENENENYDIKDTNNNYICLLGDNNILLYENKDTNNLLIYSYDDNEKNYKNKYVFQYNSFTTLKKEINDIKDSKYLDIYLFNKELDITKNGKQEFINGIFINNNKEKLGISSYTKPPLIGLGNIGATCYMNATIQCLSNIESLTNYFLIYQKIFLNNRVKYDLTREYAKLIKNLWEVKPIKKFYEPYDFKSKIGEKNSLFSGIAANDSKDLILFIFEELHKELNNPNLNLEINNANNIMNQINENVEYKNFKNNYYSQNNSIIQSIFYGEQESFNVCHNCKKKIINYNIISFLIFPLEKVRQYLIVKKQNAFEKVYLSDCFDEFISEEVMSGQNNMYCNTCNTFSSYSMFNRIYRHPEIMVIILNRGKGLEFQVEFEYPRKFILNNYIDFDNNENYQKNDVIEYELIGLITHLGDSSMSGHFIAYCKSPVDKKWYLYNDSIVSKCDNNFDNLNNNESNSIPYVLFYQINNKKLKRLPKPNIIPENNIFNNNNNNNNAFNNNNNNLKEITLYFNFSNGKELYLDIDENTTFNDAISFMVQKYHIMHKEYKCFRGNNEEIDGSKSIKQLGLRNEEHIKVQD